MDCPNCGVYNPEERDSLLALRSSTAQTRGTETKQQIRSRPCAACGSSSASSLVIWILLTWLLPMLTGGLNIPGP